MIKINQLCAMNHDHRQILIAKFINKGDSQSVDSLPFAFRIWLERPVNWHQSILHTKSMLLARGAATDEIFYQTNRYAMTGEMLVES